MSVFAVLNTPRHSLLCALAAFSAIIIGEIASCQDMEPRKWAHLPVDLNYFVSGYRHSEDDIFFDPALRIESAVAKKRTFAMGYIRTFEAFGKSSRLDILQGWQKAHWEGLLNGAPAETEREGLTDTALRFSTYILGAPPLKAEELLAYRASRAVDTIVGLGLVVQLPTGQYDETKLLNIGGNRFVFRPQLGLLHTNGPWSFESTAQAAIFTANDSFFNGNRLEQDPYYSIEGYATYSWRNGLWASVGTGFAQGGRTKINGTYNDDRRRQDGWSATLGYRLTPSTSIKATFIQKRTRARIGEDNRIITVSLSALW